MVRFFLMNEQARPNYESEAWKNLLYQAGLPIVVCGLIIAWAYLSDHDAHTRLAQLKRGEAMTKFYAGQETEPLVESDPTPDSLPENNEPTPISVGEFGVAVQALVDMGWPVTQMKINDGIVIIENGSGAMSCGTLDQTPGDPTDNEYHEYETVGAIAEQLGATGSNGPVIIWQTGAAFLPMGTDTSGVTAKQIAPDSATTWACFRTR